LLFCRRFAPGLAVAVPPVPARAAGCRCSEQPACGELPLHRVPVGTGSQAFAAGAGLPSPHGVVAGAGRPGWLRLPRRGWSRIGVIWGGFGCMAAPGAWAEAGGCRARSGESPAGTAASPLPSRDRGDTHTPIPKHPDPSPVLPSRSRHRFLADPGGCSATSPGTGSNFPAPKKLAKV